MLDMVCVRVGYLGKWFWGMDSSMEAMGMELEFMESWSGLVGETGWCHKGRRYKVVGLVR